MRRVLLLALFGPALLSPAAVGADWPAPTFALARPRPPKEGGVNEPYGGIVTAVTKDSITIQYAKDAPVTFAVSEPLAAGAVPMEPRPVPGRKRTYFAPISALKPVFASSKM